MTRSVLVPISDETFEWGDFIIRHGVRPSSDNSIHGTQRGGTFLYIIPRSAEKRNKRKMKAEGGK